MPIKVDAWSGTTNLMAAQLDDFQVILGMDFLHAAKVLPMPYLGSVCIFGEETPCMIPVAQKGKSETEFPSAIQLEKGLKVIPRGALRRSEGLPPRLRDGT